MSLFWQCFQNCVKNKWIWSDEVFKETRHSFCSKVPSAATYEKSYFIWISAFEKELNLRMFLILREVWHSWKDPSGGMIDSIQRASAVQGGAGWENWFPIEIILEFCNFFIQLNSIYSMQLNRYYSIVLSRVSRHSTCNEHTHPNGLTGQTLGWETSVSKLTSLS